jgi:rare lipoprotein A
MRLSLKAVPAVLAFLLMLPMKLIAKSMTGEASWYGKTHQGKRMANGKPFDRMQLTAASKTLPLGTRVKVTCLKTGQSIWVTITDRGPFVGRRILDLSEAAALAIGLKPYGVAQVRIQ